ncbi:MAG: hypothetical protein WA728_19980 [Xanthobacteraceae bacterium]
MTVTDKALQLIELGTFFAAMIALVVCGCIFTRTLAKKTPSTPQEEIKPVEAPLGG